MDTSFGHVEGRPAVENDAVAMDIAAVGRGLREPASRRPGTNANRASTASAPLGMRQTDLVAVPAGASPPFALDFGDLVGGVGGGGPDETVKVVDVGAAAESRNTALLAMN